MPRNKMASASVTATSSSPGPMHPMGLLMQCRLRLYLQHPPKCRSRRCSGYMPCGWSSSGLRAGWLLLSSTFCSWCGRTCPRRRWKPTGSPTFLPNIGQCSAGDDRRNLSVLAGDLQGCEPIVHRNLALTPLSSTHTLCHYLKARHVLKMTRRLPLGSAISPSLKSIDTCSRRRTSCIKRNRR
ncbi:hypothetical protein GQ600_24152 [Phytophthora cactorum]|nr:hypothetical protein GQ600_24152 [Phytophthora cactorum]